MDARSPDAQLVAAFDEHADALFRFCYAFTGDRERARDAVQESFARTWEYLARGKRIRIMKPFLYRTARNLLTDWSRRPQTASLEQEMEIGFDAADPRDPLIDVAAAHALYLVSRLEPAYREALTLRFIEGLSPRDIAELTGETENTISVRIHRGIRQLQRFVDPTTT